jgi:hypothetical protein
VQTKEVLVTAPNSTEESDHLALSGLKAAESALADPLKEETRKARLYLLGVSMVSIAIVWTGLVPQEITTLGIKFGEANRQALLLIFALVVGYFLVAFSVYGASDYLASRYAYLNAVWSEGVVEARRMDEEDRKAVTEAQTEVEAARERLEAARKRWTEARKSASASDTDADVVVDGLGNEVDEAEHRHALAVHKATVLQEVGIERGINLDFDASREEKWAREIGLGVTRQVNRYSTLAPRLSLARRLFDFLLPIFVGIYAIYALLFT